MAFRDPNIQAPARLNPAVVPTFINPGSSPLCIPPTTPTPPPPATVVISPGSATLPPGGAQQFTANVPVTWSATLGTISAAGLFVAPVVTAATIVTITATSIGDPSIFSTVSISVQPSIPPAITVAISPTSVTLNPGQTQQFTAVVTGSSDQTVTWSLVPGVGTITTAGLYTAPATIASATTVTVTAVATANVNATAHTVVTLNPSVGPPPTQLDLVQWWQLSTKATQHLVGDPSAPYHVDWVDTDPGYPATYPRGTIWAVKNKLGNPWDVLRYDANHISHWMTENGDSADQAACQSANGTTCWLYARAYKRDLIPIPLMPRFFTPGTTITLDTPSANTTINRTTNCESTVTVVHLGPVHCITTGPHKISWGGSIDHGSGTLANGPNFDTVHGVDTIRSQYYYSQDASQPSGYAALEETFYVLGFGRVAWYYILRGVFQQKTVNTVLASGGHPVLNFPCGPGKPWFV